MPTNAKVASYQSQQILSASPARLVFMLYERAITSLNEAIAAIDAGKIEARWRANKRATEIVSHMWSTLDRARGGEIAENLDRLFAYMMRRLPEIDLRNDRNAAGEIIQLLQPLRDAWRELSNAPVTPLEAPVGAPAQPPAPAEAARSVRTVISA